MKKHLLLGLLACAIISCDNQESNDSVDCGTTTIKYVYKGIEYAVEMREQSDGSFEEVSEMAPELEQAFLLPAPYFVQDSLDGDKFYIYDSVPNNVEIYETENTIAARENKHIVRASGYDEEEDYDNAGHVYTYDEANSMGNICISFTVRKSDFNAQMKIDGKATDFWGVRYLSYYAANDKITSIYVYSNRSGKESNKYKIRFFEDDNFKGSCLELTCTIIDNDGTFFEPLVSNHYICDKQDNLSKVIRKKRWLRSNISWNNCISSFYYFYTKE